MPEHDEDAYLGRIIGDSVTEVRFRARYGAPLYVGDILVAEDADSGDRFLLRATNVRHGAEAASPDWMERTAGSMLRLGEQAGPAGGLAERDWRLFQVGQCALLGHVRGNAFRKAKTIPAHFSRVRRASLEDWDFLQAYAGDLPVGHLRSGDEVIPLPVGIQGSDAFPHHVGVFATTGMGKSNLMKVLAASAISSGQYGMLILDPHGEYHDGGSPKRKGLMHHPKARENLVVYSARRLKGPHRPIRVSAHEIGAGDLMNIYEFSGPQKELLDAARHRFGAGWLVDIGEKSAQELAQAFQGQFHEGTVNVIKRRTARIFRHGLVHRDPAVSMTAEVHQALRAGKVVLVDTGGLFETEELLVATVLARAIFDANKNAFGDEAFERMPPCLITLEEAQRVLGKGTQASSNIFAQIAREGRKFKTGLCAITQQPKLLDTEVISQFNTLFILGLSDKRDRDILQDSAKQDVSQLENEIQCLMPGEALITSPHVPFALPVKVHLYEEHIERLRAEAPPPLAAAPSAGADFY
jgi:DNA helicase HerA-like ATPase